MFLLGNMVLIYECFYQINKTKREKFRQLINIRANYVVIHYAAPSLITVAKLGILNTSLDP